MCDILDCGKEEIASRVDQLRDGHGAQADPEAPTPVAEPVMSRELVLYKAPSHFADAGPSRAAEEEILEPVEEEPPKNFEFD